MIINDYKSPARLDDLLTIKTIITEVKKATIVFNQQLWKDDICLSEATVIVASVNLTKMKPIAIPNHILNALQAVQKYSRYYLGRLLFNVAVHLQKLIKIL